MKPIFLILAVVSFVACGDGGNTANVTDDGPKTQADSLLQEVIDGHDVAMPKMKKLERLAKESKAAIDSLAALPAAKQNDFLRTRLQTIHTNLLDAEQKMHEWMKGFKYDSLKDNETARVQYLQDQKTSVTIMKDAVLGSIEKAEAVLGAK